MLEGSFVHSCTHGSFTEGRKIEKMRDYYQIQGLSHALASYGEKRLGPLRKPQLCDVMA